MHLCMAYVITFWTCFVLQREYKNIGSMRLQFLASEQRRPDQFTVHRNSESLGPLSFSFLDSNVICDLSFLMNVGSCEEHSSRS